MMANVDRKIQVIKESLVLKKEERANKQIRNLEKIITEMEGMK